VNTLFVVSRAAVTFPVPFEVVGGTSSAPFSVVAKCSVAATAGVAASSTAATAQPMKRARI
jgi:hypothetical protein